MNCKCRQKVKRRWTWACRRDSGRRQWNWVSRVSPSPSLASPASIVGFFPFLVLHCQDQTRASSYIRHTFTFAGCKLCELSPQPADRKCFWPPWPVDGTLACCYCFWHAMHKITPIPPQPTQGPTAALMHADHMQIPCSQPTPTLSIHRQAHIRFTFHISAVMLLHYKAPHPSPGIFGGDQWMVTQQVEARMGGPIW